MNEFDMGPGNNHGPIYLSFLNWYTVVTSYDYINLDIKELWL